MRHNPARDNPEDRHTFPTLLWRDLPKKTVLPRFSVWLTLAILAGPSIARGQEAIRQSLAGEAAAEARRKAATSMDNTNLRLGPTAWSFDAGLSIEANDNIMLYDYGDLGNMSDLILRPELGARMLWPVSDKNSLSLSLGGGYRTYMQHSEYNGYFIRPGSELSFDLYVGDFWINLHDRFSIVQDDYQDPTAVGVVSQSRLENSIGLSAVWDLNKVIVKSGFDHVTYMALEDQTDSVYYYQAPDGESEVFSLQGGFLFRPELQAGLELGTSLLSYDSVDYYYQPYRTAMQYNAGVYTDWRMSEYLKVLASVGYMVFSPDFYDWAADAGDFSGVYAQVDLTHRLSQHLTQSLSAGRQESFTYYGGSIDLYFARWSANWRVFEKTTLGASLVYEHGSQLYTYEETFDRVGPGISLTRQMTKKLSASLSYQYYWRGSDMAWREYTVNSLTLGARYRF